MGWCLWELCPSVMDRSLSSLVQNDQQHFVQSVHVDAGATAAILGEVFGGIFSLALLLARLTVCIIIAFIVWYRKRKANLQGFVDKHSCGLYCNNNDIDIES